MSGGSARWNSFSASVNGILLRCVGERCGFPVIGVERKCPTRIWNVEIDPNRPAASLLPAAIGTALPFLDPDLDIGGLFAAADWIKSEDREAAP